MAVAYIGDDSASQRAARQAALLT